MNVLFSPNLHTEAFLLRAVRNRAAGLRVLMASLWDFRVKGSDKLLCALSLVKIPFEAAAVRYGRDVKRAEKLAKYLRFDVKFIDKVPHDAMNQLY